MKVAVVVRSLKIGGMERVAISLTKAFQDEGHESHLIYFKEKKEHYSTDGIKNVHHWNFDKIMLKSVIGIFYEILIRLLNIPFRQSYALTKGFVTSFLFKSKLKYLESDGKPFDLIIIRGQGTFEFLWYKQDKRYVQVCENILYPDHKMTYFRKLHAKILYDSKNIACVSNGVLESFNRLEVDTGLKAKKAIKLTNPIDIKYIEKSSQEFPVAINAPYIVNVGRVAPVKQLSLLIEAYAYMKKNYELPHKLVLVGQGHDEENVRAKIQELKLESFVIMVGLQINPYPYLANADLFALSSKHEGLGMVLLEALACKTVVVATKSKGGVSDIMQNELADFLCDATPQALGDLMAKELLNPTPLDFEKHIKEFLPDTIVNRYIKEFQLES